MLTKGVHMYTQLVEEGYMVRFKFIHSLAQQLYRSHLLSTLARFPFLNLLPIIVDAEWST